ncbi:hypothetical protein [Streptomyces sp. NPDC047043]|uniref:hypothetical protein n=1 Tax=Streptomyces sp. NPDC047043 TaxID=3154497 RepID=UPI0033CB75EF
MLHQSLPEPGQYGEAEAGIGQFAAQALADEGAILARDTVRTALVVKQGGRMTCRWEGLSGRLYTLALDEQERAFLGLVLSMVGIAHVTIPAVEELDERRLLVIQRAILRLSGNDRIAVGTRL